MNYEIKRVHIAHNELHNEEKILNDAGAAGWEPYALNDSFHYFRRPAVVRQAHYDKPAEQRAAPSALEIVAEANAGHPSLKLRPVKGAGSAGNKEKSVSVSAGNEGKGAGNEQKVKAPVAKKGKK